MELDRTILIAGSRQGLGRALAEHYVDQGDRVIGLSRAESDLVHERYRHICADVTDDGAVQRAFSEISDAGYRVDVVVNSAIGEKALAATRASLTKPDNLALEEITGAIDYCGSDAARPVTGQTLSFGGVR